MLNKLRGDLCLVTNVNFQCTFNAWHGALPFELQYVHWHTWSKLFLKNVTECNYRKQGYNSLHTATSNYSPLKKNPENRALELDRDKHDSHWSGLLSFLYLYCANVYYTPINCKMHNFYLTPGEGASSLRLHSQKSDGGYVKIQYSRRPKNL